MSHAKLILLVVVLGMSHGQESESTPRKYKYRDPRNELASPRGLGATQV